ncbi:MAG: HipA domain-containing protein [Polyangiaceae bacterium]
MFPPGAWRLHAVEEWPLIGAAPKGYLAYGDPQRPDCHAYIAKKGRLVEGGNRECVTEEMISKIGASLPVRMARSRLVRLPVGKGQPEDVRFLSRNFVRWGEERLVHGIEIVAEYFNARPEEVAFAFELDNPRAEQNFYTIHNMVEVFRWFCRDDAERAAILRGFARMLAFDALVGAPDRHATNWGVVVSLAEPGLPKRFAPLFDTARGLFREHTDEKLSAILKAGDQAAYIRSYAEKSCPVFGIAGHATGRRCNHFDLVACALRDMRTDLGEAMAGFIRSVHMPHLETLILRKFRRLITPVRTSFVVGLLQHRHDRLKMLMEKTYT